MTIASVTALKAYQNALQADAAARKSAVAPDLSVKQSDNFTATLKDSVKKVNEMQKEKNAMIESFASGKSQNVHELMITLQKAGLAVKLTSTVRSKVMEAYKELSHMSF
ncbi:MAG: flagellar hook-basal body complex protein FliE [Thermodesulfobacteriota bacterium]